MNIPKGGAGMCRAAVLLTPFTGGLGLASVLIGQPMSYPVKYFKCHPEIYVF